MRIQKCAFALLFFVSLFAGLYPSAAVTAPPLLAQLAPAEAEKPKDEKPKNEKPSPEEEKISPEKVTLGIVGGLAIFLFGVEQLARALKAVSGDRMKRLLGRFTTTPFAGLLTGTLATRGEALAKGKLPTSRSLGQIAAVGVAISSSPHRQASNLPQWENW
jgi:hypothetical protein